MDNILCFPATTLVNKFVPKNAFWQRAEGRTELKDFLTREFESITWLYKLAASTLNVADGESVHEVDVFYCKMRSESYSINPFCGMDDLMPRHTLYIIEHGASIDMLMQHKEKVGDKWKRGKTEILRNVELSILNFQFSIVAQTMDAVYSSLLSQISGLNIANVVEYKTQTAENERREKIRKQIDALERKARKETQPRRKFEIVQQINELKKTL